MALLTDKKLKRDFFQASDILIDQVPYQAARIRLSCVFAHEARLSDLDFVTETMVISKRSWLLSPSGDEIAMLEVLGDYTGAEDVPENETYGHKIDMERIRLETASLALTTEENRKRRLSRN